MDNSNSSKKGLNQKQKKFCFYFVDTLSAEQAAKKAGYKKAPLQKGRQLLCDPKIIAEIKNQLEQQKQLCKALVTSGYQRLAFGSVADAVSLLYMESPDKKTLENMDLFMVSEIRKPRDGAMEIKFFDRMKALEKLSQGSDDPDDNRMGLMGALCMGAQKISEEDDDSGV